MRIPRITVAAASSGSGKTSFTLGLIGALKGRGLDVRPFKAGPDYLDAALHAAVAGRPSRNLDLFLMGRDAVIESMSRNAAGCDLALVEGVMGYLDGLSLSSSTADVARAIDSPVLLLLDAASSSESLGAVALGFARSREGRRIRGFVLNGVAGEGHFETARAAIEAETGIPVLGCLPRSDSLSLPERHLGLLGPAEAPGFWAVARALSEAVDAHVDLDSILAIAREAHGLRAPSQRWPSLRSRVPTAQGRTPAALPIAVARDAAFSFYYEDNFDAMRDAGLEPVFFSPLSDRRLPPEAAGLYIGGGYPELHARELAENSAMRDSILGASRAGLPVYAECGGYLYLLESLVDSEGRAFPLCGVLPGVGRMGPGLAEIGYRECATASDSILGPAGSRLVGHVFHCAKAEGSGPEASGSVYASWLHLHFAGNPRALAAFADACRAFAARANQGRVS
jgi:cobyrinic acid a,c-diamide synthase